MQIILEGQEMAVRDHHMEYKSNMWIGESVTLTWQAWQKKPIVSRVGVWNWPLNICTYNGCQKELPKNVCQILQSYTVACMSISTSKMDFNTQNFHRSQWGFINYSTLETMN